jgi:hypothetical protein
MVDNRHNITEDGPLQMVRITIGEISLLPNSKKKFFTLGALELIAFMLCQTDTERGTYIRVNTKLLERCMNDIARLQ